MPLNEGKIKDVEFMATMCYKIKLIDLLANPNGSMERQKDRYKCKKAQNKDNNVRQAS